MPTGGALAGLWSGVLMPGERKSVEPLAAVTAQHRSLLDFVANAPRSDERVPAQVRNPFDRTAACAILWTIR